MKKLKSILAIFTLAVFLFPQVEIGIHDYKHRNDFICKSVKEHFHTAQHHCILCDFTNNLVAYSSVNQFNLILQEGSSLKYFFSQDNYPVAQKGFLQLRGPPSLA